ncbi:MAG TPA: asparagine synthase (glutamine-hydrolyzing) [Actinomycetota bacterium]|nr:asparagine synthase (glutamine-hydrolyzing) [Actinomycetota bacterium]
MCGIAGIFHLDPDARVAPEHLQAMNASLAHRGPDASGVFHRGPIGLASQRLAIIDPAGGDQPIANHTGTAWIVFNGEIYNHIELRRELEGFGYAFRTRTDTEVILHAYDRWGERCLERLNGMFAFAIWDQPTATLFLARDRLGIKPLFVSATPRTVAFGSEAKALLTLPWIRPELDPDGLMEYLFCGYTLGRRTFFRGIESLPAGHWMRITARGSQVSEYWDVPAGGLGDRPPDRQLLEHLHSLLDDCVARELEADVPVGSCLSGGLDSSLTATLAARHRPELPTFTIGYEANSALFAGNPRRIVGEVVGDDMAYADAVARRLGSEHHAFTLPTDELLAELDRMIWHREKPMITASEYGHFALAEHAGRRVRVLLSGQGADELFGGYYYWWRFGGPENTTFFPWITRTAPSSPEYPVTRTDLYEHLLRPDVVTETDSRRAHQDRFDDLMARAGTTDFFNAISYLLVKTHLHEMLELEDRHAMTHSVETRVPFLDHRLVEWTLSLPGTAKVERTGEKPLLKRMARRFLPELPEEVLQRTKSPMPPPFDLDALVHDEMLATLRRPERMVETFLDPSRLDPFLAELEAAPPAPGSQRRHVLFSLYCLERWHDMFARDPAGVRP